ncbi:hypothetical protein, partial [Xanthovirga aplysinae]|uniref:hypothetical protein n=1 Tax=Xanthovirga aplysinae TaxID=2529853 RepID=UPI001CA3C788
WYDERGLSDISFAWLMDRASNCGLKLKKGWKKYLKQDPLVNLHDERKRNILWRVWSPVKRKILTGAKLHQSVIDRMETLPNYCLDLPNKYTIVTNESYDYSGSSRVIPPKLAA